MESGTKPVAERDASGVTLAIGGRDPDEGVFGEIYQDLRRFSAVVGRAGADPDDLLQDALARVLSKHPLSSLDDPARYLRVVVLRLAANERRRAARDERAMNRLAEAVPYEFEIPGLSDYLSLLSPRERAVLYLGIVEDRTAEEVGRMLGMRAGAVRTAKARALKRLRAASGRPISE